MLWLLLLAPLVLWFVIDHSESKKPVKLDPDFKAKVQARTQASRPPKDRLDQFQF